MMAGAMSSAPSQRSLSARRAAAPLSPVSRKRRRAGAVVIGAPRSSAPAAVDPQPGPRVEALEVERADVEVDALARRRGERHYPRQPRDHVGFRKGRLEHGIDELIGAEILDSRHPDRKSHAWLVARRAAAVG